MGRGRVQLKRIENKINRQATFSKRRSGLIKKAHEISVLCDAEVAVIIFSAKGKLFEYSSDSRMESILEKYERYAYSERQLIESNLETQGSWTLQHAKLKARLEFLQRNHRHYMGEDLDTLSLKELQNLEHQLETSLRHIRSKKNQLMHESISELQKKDKALQEQNNLLTKKIKEKEKKEKAEKAQLQQQNRDPNASSDASQPSPTINNSHGTYLAEGSGNVIEIPLQDQRSTVMPPWMICHINGGG
ncbi:hypothetical protein NMG60_11023938 [Bertholletia excelsa]